MGNHLGCYSFLSSSDTTAKNSAINSLLLLPAFFSFLSSNKFPLVFSQVDWSWFWLSVTGFKVISLINIKNRASNNYKALTLNSLLQGRYITITKILRETFYRSMRALLSHNFSAICIYHLRL